MALLATENIVTVATIRHLPSVICNHKKGPPIGRPFMFYFVVIIVSH